MAMTVRPAAPADYDSICALLGLLAAAHSASLPELYRLPDGPMWSAEYYSAQLASSEALALVAEADGEVVGFANALLRDTSPIPVVVPRRYAQVENIVVSPR